MLKEIVDLKKALIKTREDGVKEVTRLQFRLHEWENWYSKLADLPWHMWRAIKKVTRPRRARVNCWGGGQLNP